jgi:hypothetical protein
MDCPGRVVKGKIPSPSSLQLWALVMGELSSFCFFVLCKVAELSHSARKCVVVLARGVEVCGVRVPRTGRIA